MIFRPGSDYSDSSVGLRQPVPTPSTSCRDNSCRDNISSDYAASPHTTGVATDRSVGSAGDRTQDGSRPSVWGPLGSNWRSIPSFHSGPPSDLTSDDFGLQGFDHNRSTVPHRGRPPLHPTPDSVQSCPLPDPSRSSIQRFGGNGNRSATHLAGLAGDQPDADSTASEYWDATTSSQVHCPLEDSDKPWKRNITHVRLGIDRICPPNL